jgi:uncharacterized protein (TIGR03083 family)
MDTAGCHRLSHAEYCATVATEIAQFATAVTGVNPDTRVPSCPDWTVTDLVEHLGLVHRWAEHQVRVLTPERIASADMGLDSPDGPADWPRWLRTGGERLVATLRASDPAAPMWAWGLEQTAGFWARRMVHETTVHRADAALATDAPYDVPAPVAVDGVDELFDNLPPAVRFAPNVAQLRGNGETLRLETTDLPATWHLALHDDGFAWSHTDVPADVTVRAPARELLLLVYGRLAPDEVDVDGDGALLRRWLADSAI